ncbi:hypothetical protein RCL_jg6889.t1 [Rhizophagus clarus]|uniref:Uncharacterized protein n=1 Tax=Rhizophagus clarus TaxID=94130 RepID=A0A8H3QLM0_9GLOM|nr:hypothetical protein RCL_jg6889.t1 [Rhizophagus clarus]
MNQLDPFVPMSIYVSSSQSPEQTPSSSKVVIFNNVPLQPVTLSKHSDINNKSLKQPQNNQDKKRKQDHLADNFNNSNLILTGYCPQQEEQNDVIPSPDLDSRNVFQFELAILAILLDASSLPFIKNLTLNFQVTIGFITRRRRINQHQALSRPPRRTLTLGLTSSIGWIQIN